MRAAFIFLLGAALLLAVPTPSALACTCAWQSPETHRAAADVVFDGVVVSQSVTQRRRSVLVRVRRVWKGAVPRVVRVSTAKTGSMCGSHFEVGERYLVFASGRRRRFSTGFCTGTQQLDSGAETVLALGAPARRYGSQEVEADEQVEEASGPVEIRQDDDPPRGRPRRIE